MSSNKIHKELEELRKGNSILHENIIDLYLQVKIRSNDEIDGFGEKDLINEKERLKQFDSLIVLDYIRTSIEILMQMKLEEEKGTEHGNAKDLKRDKSDVSNSYNSNQKLQNSQTPLSSTTKSLDLPPKEYEQQLQQYEGEVRNHIKVEQQLKLHIEVLQEKLDDMEKEKNQILTNLEQQKQEIERQIKQKIQQSLHEKDKEVEKLSNELKKAQKTISVQSQAIEKQRVQAMKQLNNIQNQNSQSNEVTQQTESSLSKSPPNVQSRVESDKNNAKQVVKTKGKSPYLNDSFYKLNPGALTTFGSNTGQQSSNNSSAKSSGNGQKLKQYEKRSNKDQQNIAIIKKPKKEQQINQSGDNMKVIAAIQRMRTGNQSNINPVSQNENQHKKTKSHSHYYINARQNQAMKQNAHYHNNSDTVGSWAENFNSYVQEKLNSSQPQFAENSNLSSSQKVTQKSKVASKNHRREQNSLERGNSQKGSRKAQNIDPSQIKFKNSAKGGSSDMTQKRKAQNLTQNSIIYKDNGEASGRNTSNYINKASKRQQDNQNNQNDSLNNQRAYQTSQGNNMAANQQDFIKNTNPNTTADAQQRRTQQPIILQQRIRPKSQAGNLNS